MSIIVSDKQENLIKVSMRYVSKGHNGVVIFNDEGEEREWIESHAVAIANKKLEYNIDEIPKSLMKSPSEKIEELNTFWKRMDWGTQNKILKESRVPDSDDIDYMIYQFSLMKYLMTDWDFMDKKGNKVPLDERIFEKMDYKVASHLISRYEKELNSEDELANFV